MASIRTQIYLTAEQRAAIDGRTKRNGESLAWIVREALDQYLDLGPQDLKSALDRSFGTVPDLEVPSRKEWNRFDLDLNSLPRRPRRPRPSVRDGKP
jgi:hypothetical protein